MHGDRPGLWTLGQLFQPGSLWSSDDAALGSAHRSESAHRAVSEPAYDETTRFHPTFLYESLWNIGVVAVLLLIERRFRRFLRTGDIFLLYGIFYSLGRVWIEGLRTDSLCSNGVGGSCDGSLRTAQVVSLLVIVGFSAASRLPPSAQATDRQPPSTVSVESLPS